MHALQLEELCAWSQTARPAGERLAPNLYTSIHFIPCAWGVEFPKEDFHLMERGGIKNQWGHGIS